MAMTVRFNNVCMLGALLYNSIIYMTSAWMHYTVCCIIQSPIEEYYMIFLTIKMLSSVRKLHINWRIDFIIISSGNFERFNNG